MTCDNASLQLEPDDLILQIAQRARAAQKVLAAISDVDKAAALRMAAIAIRQAEAIILAANMRDVRAAQDKDLSVAMIDRLRLDPERLRDIAATVETVADLPDPIGRVIDQSDRPNGLKLSRIRVPIGVLGIIYESRPNVTADAAALSVRAGNAAILRGGSEALHSNRAIHAAYADGLVQAGLPADSVQLIPTQSRTVVRALLAATGKVDMIIPRGGKGLVERVQADARVPVLAHLDGICHTYIHHSADAEMARSIACNAKLRRTGICGALETLLIDVQFSAAQNVVCDLIDAGCELRGDARACALDSRIIPATKEDWDTEYLAPVLAVRIVDGLDQALEHIARHSSDHTDTIVAEDKDVSERFLAEVDSAIVMVNASSQFADGGEFGLGAEIGIATGRLHARGPVALEGLTTYKWQVRGTGQVRAIICGSDFSEAVLILLMAGIDASLYSRLMHWGLMKSGGWFHRAIRSSQRQVWHRLQPGINPLSNNLAVHR